VAAGKELARQLGISEGIVAGRLQFDRIWVRFVGNDMKRRYEIEDLLPEALSA
jgi:hypothetical protein